MRGTPSHASFSARLPVAEVMVTSRHVSFPSCGSSWVQPDPTSMLVRWTLSCFVPLSWLFCILLWPVVVEDKPYERKCSLQVSSSYSSPRFSPQPILFRPSCVRTSVGFPLPEVCHLVPRVPLLAHPELRKRPWSLRGPRRDGNGDRSPPLRFFTQYIRWCFLSLVQFRCPGSCRPQPRGGCRKAASRQDTRQEPGPQFDF